MMIYVSQNITIRYTHYLLPMSPFSVPEYVQILSHLQRLMNTSCTVELALIDDYAMSEYSTQFNGIFAPTNILSFEAEQGNPSILLLSLETVQRESVLYSQEYDKYILHLLTHGFVHSCGFEHGVEMEKHCARCYYMLLSFL